MLVLEWNFGSILSVLSLKNFHLYFLISVQFFVFKVKFCRLFDVIKSEKVCPYTAGIGVNVSNRQPTTCLDALLQDLVVDAPTFGKEELLACFFKRFEDLFRIFLDEGKTPKETSFCSYHFFLLYLPFTFLYVFFFGLSLFFLLFGIILFFNFACVFYLNGFMKTTRETHYYRYVQKLTLITI